METRKIQSIGGSSFSLVLPKKWVKSMNLKNKDEVQIIEKSPGSLLLSLKKAHASLVKRLDVHSLSPVETERETVAMYISGCEEIEITAKDLSVEQKRAIKNMVAKLPGMEIAGESANTLVLKNLLDPEKFSFNETLQKMFSMIYLMMADAFHSFMTGNLSLAEDVIERDEEIDKIYFLIQRIYHSMLTDKISQEQVKTDMLLADFFQNVANGLERIADHSVKIASLARAGKLNLKPDIQSSLRTWHESTAKNFKAASECALKINRLEAHGLLEELKKQDQKRPGFHEEILKANSGPAMLLFDSLDRTNSYLKNMAEYVLDMSLAKD